MWWITGVPIWHDCFLLYLIPLWRCFGSCRPQGVSSSFTHQNLPKQSLSYIGVPLGLTLLLVNLFDFLIQRRPNEIWHNSVKLVDFNGSEYVCLLHHPICQIKEWMPNSQVTKCGYCITNNSLIQFSLVDVGIKKHWLGILLPFFTGQQCLTTESFCAICGMAAQRSRSGTWLNS